MKVTLVLLFSTVACLVNALPIEHISGYDNFIRLRRRFDPQPDPMSTTQGTANTGDTQKPPSLISSVTGPVSPPTAGSDFTIQYNDNSNEVPFNYGDCVPFKNDNGIRVNFAKFRELVTCSIYQDGQCKNLQHPVPVPLPGNIQVLNALGVGSTLAGSYRCYSVPTTIKALPGQ